MIKKMYTRLRAKYPLSLSDFNELEFSRDFREILKYEVSRKSVQWEPSSMRADTRTQTDTTPLKVTFHNISNAPKNVKCLLIFLLILLQKQMQYILHTCFNFLDKRVFNNHNPLCSN